MTDPCDNLSDELVDVVLFEVRFTKLSPRERRAMGANGYYGETARSWKGYREHSRLISASLRSFFANHSATVKSKAEAHRMFDQEYPAINNSAEAVLPRNHPLVRR